MSWPSPIRQIVSSDEVIDIFTAAGLKKSDISVLSDEFLTEVRDLQTLFGLGDVHGAIWFRERRIAEDEQLDPARHPGKRGRYHFTLAHEAGHWRLHRKHFTVPEGQKDLFDGDPEPGDICRSTDREVPMEWLADCFAAYLLMPYNLVRSAWPRRNDTNSKKCRTTFSTKTRAKRAKGFGP